MAIEKLVEFAKEGSKSIAGLVLLSGFPREEKPAREWFNYLFNSTFRSINALIDELERMRIELEFVKKNGALPDTPDVGEDTPIDPDVPVEPEQNPVGTWKIKQITSAILTTASSFDIGNIVYQVEHSSGKKVKDVVMTWQQGGYPTPNGTLYTAPAKDTDSKGVAIFTFRSEYLVDQRIHAHVTATAPNNPVKSSIFVLLKAPLGGTTAAGE